MIDIDELRRLTQAATPGPWFSDARGNIWRRPLSDLYENGGSVAGDKPIAFVAAGWRGEGVTGYPVENNARLIAASNPSAVIELLDRLEAAERERDALRAKVSDSAINIEYLGNLKKSYEEFIGKLQDERNDLQTELKEVRYRTAVAHDTIKALRAKIEEMEQQEPVAWLHESRRDSDVVTSAVKHVWGKVAVGSLAAYSIPLYLAPGAKGEEK